MEGGETVVTMYKRIIYFQFKEYEFSAIYCILVKLKPAQMALSQMHPSPSVDIVLSLLGFKHLRTLALDFHAK